VAGVTAAGEPPRVLKRVTVYSEPGRFAGWPANHGIWSWGDENLATLAPDTGQGNPPCLVRLVDGRLCLTYGYRARPFAIHARLSSDQGKTWTNPFVLRGDGGSQDIGYPRSVVRSDGKVVTVYAFHDRAGSVRDIEATIWDPGSR